MTACLRRIAASILVILAIGVVTTASATEDDRLNAFFEEVFQRNVKDSPILQSQLGMKGPDYGKWGDFSDAEQMRQNELVKQDLARLRSEFRHDALSERMKVSYRIFELLQETALRDFPWRFHNYSFQTMSNPVTSLVTFMQNVHRVDDASDAEAYISRITAIELTYRQSIEIMNLAADRGVVPTSYSFDPVLADARNVLTGEPFDGSGKDSAILADFRGKVDKLAIPDSEKKRLMDAGVAAMRGPMRGGVEAMLAAIEGLRSKSPGPNGVWKLPDGDAYYKNRIEFWTTEPKLGADEIHQVGLDEVARIRGEMQAIMQKVGFKGDLPAFFRHLRTDPANF